MKNEIFPSLFSQIYSNFCYFSSNSRYKFIFLIIGAEICFGWMRDGASKKWWWTMWKKLRILTAVKVSIAETVNSSKNNIKMEKKTPEWKRLKNWYGARLKVADKRENSFVTLVTVANREVSFFHARKLLTSSLISVSSFLGSTKWPCISEHVSDQGVDISSKRDLPNVTSLIACSPCQVSLPWLC